MRSTRNCISPRGETILSPTNCRLFAAPSFYIQGMGGVKTSRLRDYDPSEAVAAIPCEIFH